MQPERLAVQTETHAPLVPGFHGCAVRVQKLQRLVGVLASNLGVHDALLEVARFGPREDGVVAHAQALGQDGERAHVRPRHQTEVHPVLDLLVLRRGRVRLVRDRRYRRAVQVHRVAVRRAPDDFQPESRHHRVVLARQLGRLEGRVVPQELRCIAHKRDLGQGRRRRHGARLAEHARVQRHGLAPGAPVKEAGFRPRNAAQRRRLWDVRGVERDAHASQTGGQVAGVAHDQHGGPRRERERAALEVGDDDARRVVLDERDEAVVRARVVLKRDDVPGNLREPRRRRARDGALTRGHLREALGDLLRERVGDHLTACLRVSHSTRRGDAAEAAVASARQSRATNVFSAFSFF
mmetsp:Transcript_3632/g.15380  ORF Transcript_3632/g.15380 Transcript_3632/m.15380 type:complete len:352 (+) Transcript_3632:487-1542(+)